MNWQLIIIAFLVFVVAFLIVYIGITIAYSPQWNCKDANYGTPWIEIYNCTLPNGVIYIGKQGETTNSILVGVYIPKGN